MQTINVASGTTLSWRVGKNATTVTLATVDIFMPLSERKFTCWTMKFGHRLRFGIHCSGKLVATQTLVIGILLLMNVVVRMAIHARDCGFVATGLDQHAFESFPFSWLAAAMAIAAGGFGVLASERKLGFGIVRKANFLIPRDSAVAKATIAI